MNPFIPLTSLIIFIFLYFVMSQYFSHRRFNYLQETSIAIVVGVIIGVIVNCTTDFFVQQSNNQSFIRDIIFLILLPPIMFEDGYNFPKRKFFQNILYVNLYGFVGTILNFVTLWGILFAFNNAGLYTSVSDNNQIITLQNWQLLLIAAALCSIEPIVTQKVVDKQRYPKLFSIIFGQCLYKDTIAITLFDSIKDMVADNDINFDIEGADIGFLILRFLQVILGSIVIGIIFSLITTVIFKNFRFLVEQKGISQVSLTILTGYLAYVVSEWLTFSGVISMLFCGTMLSHYNIYNLTEQGKEATMITIQVLKIVASGLIFFFIGFQLFGLQSFQSAIDGALKSPFSLQLLGVTLLGMLIGRIINVYLMSLIGYLCTNKQKWRLNSYEYFIIFVSGLVHGAVPFALSVTIPELSTSATAESSSSAQFDIICIILITSLLFNMFIPKIQKIMLGKVRQLRREDPTHPSVRDSFIDGALIKQNKTTMIQDDPNAPLLNKVRSRTQKYWKKFQQGLLKPHLIFDYYQRKGQIKMQKIRRRKQQHQKYIARYGTQDNQNILNVDNEEQNRFVDVQLSNTSGSDDEKEGVVRIKFNKESQPEIVNSTKKQNVKKKRTPTEQEIVPISTAAQPSRNTMPTVPIPQIVKTQSKGEIEINIQQGSQ